VNLWKMWYMGGYGAQTGYATSPDGITWTRYPSNPLTINETQRDAGMVWLDLRPGVPIWERYKMSRYRAGLEIRTSPDGTNWTPPILTYSSNTQLGGDHTTFALNPFRNKWIYLLRAQESKYSYSRYKRYAEGDSFTANNWAKFSKQPHWLRADNLDKQLWDEGLDVEENAKTPDLYDFEMAPYESLMLGFFCIQAYEAEHDFDFDPPQQVAPYRPKHNYLTLGYSRDGFHFERPDRHVWLGPADDPNPNDGQKNTPWNWGNVQVVGGLLGVVGDELYIYYTARGGWGNPDGFFTSPFWDGTHTRMGLAKMRRDGFVSHDAGEAEGTLTTRNVQFSSNPGHFFVNADVAPGGSIKVEVLNSSGVPVTGFTKSHSSSATGTGAGSTKQSITWSGGSIGSLANTTVKFKFYLTNAKLYSFWVSNSADGRSNGYVAQGGPGLPPNKDDGGAPIGTAEVEVRGNGKVIADGDSTVEASNHTDFGSVVAGGAAVTRTFTVHNTGNGILSTTGVNIPEGYHLIEGLNASIPAGGNDSFTVELPTTSAGVFTGDIGFGTNDADETTYSFKVRGTVVGPELSVMGSGLDITDGDITPYMSDQTLFGTIVQGGPSVTRTYTVTNTGTTTLTLGSVSLPSGFVSGGDALTSSLAPGASDTFNVTLPTSTQGTFDGDIAFTTNDANEEAFNFRIRGRIGPAGPEVMVIGKSKDIVNGDNTPSATDHTDFGSQKQGASPAIERRFVVTNHGTSNLTISDLRVPTGFKTSPLVPVLIPSQSHAFTVQLIPDSAPGTYSGQITFNTNDPDESVFRFSITGKILSTGDTPAVELSGNSVVIANGDTTPAANDHTDFGASATAVTRTFMVLNRGTTALTTSALAVSGGFVVTKNLSASIAAGESDTFTVQMPTTKTGSHSGVVTFLTNGEKEVPVSFNICGEITGADPEISVTSNGSEIVDNSIAPTDFGSVAEGSASVKRTFTVTNHGKSVLTLGGITLPAGFLPGADSLASSLAPATSDTFDVVLPTTKLGRFSGQVSFTTNDPNENPFNFGITGVVTSKGDPTITISVPDADASESGNPSINKGVIRFSRSSASSSPLTVNFSRIGTAIYGATGDYLLKDSTGATLTTKVVIPVNKSFADVLVEPIDNQAIESEETMGLNVIAGAGYTVGPPNSGSVTIDDNEPVVSITQTDPDANETAVNPGTVRINLTEAPTATPLSVRFTLSGSSAVHPSDYTMVVMNEDGLEGALLGGSPIIIPVGRKHLDIKIKPVEDTTREGLEAVKITLMPSSGSSYKLGSDTIATITITSNE